MPDKKCPKCKIWNSEKAIICDCGYNFITEKYEFRVKKKGIEFGILSPITAVVSSLLLIIILIMIFIINQSTGYIPNHIEEQKQHNLTAIGLLLCIIPFINLTGILAGGIFSKGKKKEQSIIINTIVFIITIILFIFIMSA